MDQKVRPGEFYRHFKNKLYQVLAVAVHSETGEEMVVYQALYGDYKVYVRPYAMFVSQVDHEKYPQVQQKYRFQQVNPGEEMEWAGEGKNQEDVCLDNGVEAGVSGGDGARIRPESKPEPEPRPEPEPQPEPVSRALMEFLDSEGYEARIASLKGMSRTATQRDLDSIYTVLDMKPQQGSIQEQLRAIAGCLKMQHHFDGGHLR
mgnify:CR=1 FL=1